MGRWLNENGLKNVLFNMPPGDWAAGERGLASLPGREEAFRAGVARAIEYARALGAPRLHAMAGLLPAEADHSRHRAVYVDNLRYAAEALATRLLLERLRRLANGARFVMTSSVAVFGGELPAVVPDSQVWAPQSSYGTQKAMADLLLSDYTRKGFVDGRSVRLPTIVVRPGKPNLAASSFASGIIREPLNGEEAVCPVAPETFLWLMSPRQVIENLLHAHDLPAERLGARRVINLPGLSIPVAGMIAALERVVGPQVTARIRMQRDPKVEQIVNSWPGDFSAEYAKSLGFVADKDFTDIIRAYVEDERVALT